MRTELFEKPEFVQRLAEARVHGGTPPSMKKSSSAKQDNSFSTPFPTKAGGGAKKEEGNESFFNENFNAGEIPPDMAEKMKETLKNPGMMDMLGKASGTEYIQIQIQIRIQIQIQIQIQSPCHITPRIAITTTNH